jgi:hypothetical protein
MLTIMGRINSPLQLPPSVLDGQGEESEVFGIRCRRPDRQEKALVYLVPFFAFGTSLPKELPEKIGSSLRRHKVP